MYTFSCGTVLSLSKMSPSCRSDYVYVISFFYSNNNHMFFKQTTTIHSVDTELIYAVLKLSFSKQYKIKCLILYTRASQTSLFCGTIFKQGFSMRPP